MKKLKKYNTKHIPIYMPSLNGNEKKYVNNCLETNWISSKGEYVSKFEKSFANYVGVNFSTTVSNGTTALHLALVALGIGEGDEVIVPTFTYIATVNAITYTKANPVFIDSESKYWQINTNKIQQKITSKTKAIIAVHLYGHPCEMSILKKICSDNNLFLIEDCAEAIGTKYKGKHVGTFGHISTFSFYGNKTISTGEGGMVISNDSNLIERAIHYKTQGLAKNRQYWHDVIGFNYRMTNICAAIGLAQIEKIELIIKRKREIAKFYSNEFEKIEQIKFHQEQPDHYHSYWMCSILVESAEVREELRNFLELNKIETRPTFYPIHTMPMYSKAYESFTVAEDLSLRGINLPSYPDLTNNDLEIIVSKIKEFYK